MNTYAIGIDPGKTGAIAFLQLHKGEYYLDSIFDFADMELYLPVLREMKERDKITSVCLELVHAAPGQGVVSMFSFGCNFGWWIGILDALQFNYTMVAPQKWQGVMFKRYKDNTGKLTGNTKDISLKVAREIFNRKLDSQGYFDRKKDHGRSDASLIGLYGTIKLN